MLQKASASLHPVPVLWPCPLPKGTTSGIHFSFHRGKKSQETNQAAKKKEDLSVPQQPGLNTDVGAGPSPFYSITILVWLSLPYDTPPQVVVSLPSHSNPLVHNHLLFSKKCLQKALGCWPSKSYCLHMFSLVPTPTPIPYPNYSNSAGPSTTLFTEY